MVTQTELCKKDAAIQVSGCADCLSLALVPEDSVRGTCVQCEQVNDSLCLVAELKEEVFDTVPHKLERDGFDEWTVRWIRSWLESCIKSIVVNSSEFWWTSVASGVPQRSILGPVHFINDIDKVIKCTLSKFADDTNLSAVVATPEGWDTIWRVLDKLEE
ncbi:rna-directed dna polymerase from mobile element jockey-like [Willisornis vidua]|uniref:Rna-directed dna polymerase from mobile element jockey-like n=1 Tax=Willisornis vidua TaxID=1566151 RepID=A0ABQ9CQ51_9PASS|nr:rna-directed dna polymerase from mobile element jockey-like [Willisornis vidua]